MVMLDFGVPYIGAEHWNGCIVKPEQECDDPQASAWTESEVHTLVTNNFKQKAPQEVWDYFSKRIFPGDIMNSLLVYMDDNQADGADAAVEFLKNNPDVWQAWVSDDASKKLMM